LRKKALFLAAFLADDKKQEAEEAEAPANEDGATRLKVVVVMVVGIARLRCCCICAVSDTTPLLLEVIIINIYPFIR